MAETRCSRCGMPGPAGARFCADCGQRLDGSASGVGAGAGAGADEPTDARETPLRPRPQAGAAVGGATAESAPILLEEGTVLGERYELRGILGKGGMGSVMAAWDRLVREEVAIKFMHPFFLQGDEGVRRFLREGRLARRLNHPNIVRTMNIESHAGLTCIVMERLRGRTLREVIRDRGLPLSVPFVVGLCDQVLAALEAAHSAGIIHRDIKPQNVWVETEDPTKVKVMDFGLAKDTGPVDGDVTMVPRLLGTPSYMAPEQGRLGGTVDLRADLHSTAVVVHELLTGSLPGSQIGLEVPEPLRPVLATALKALPEERYQSAAEMRRAWRAAAKAAGLGDALRASAAAGAHEGDSRVAAFADTTAPGRKTVVREAPAGPPLPGGARRVATAVVAAAAVVALALVAWSLRDQRVVPEGGSLATGPAGTSLVLPSGATGPGTPSAPSGPSGPTAASGADGEDAVAVPLDPVPGDASWAELVAWLADHPDHPERARAEQLRSELERRALDQEATAVAALARDDVRTAQVALAAGRALWPEAPAWEELGPRVDEAADWERAVEAKSLQAVKRFLEDHPGSAHAADAAKRVAELEKEQASDPAIRSLNEVVSLRSLERLAAFVKAAPASIQDRARRELRALATEQAEAATERAAQALASGNLAAAEAARTDVAKASDLGGLQLDLATLDRDLSALRAFDAAVRDGGAESWRSFLARPDSARSPARASRARTELARAAATTLRQRLDAVPAGGKLTEGDVDSLLALVQEGRRADPRAEDWRALGARVEALRAGAASVAAGGAPTLEAVREAAEKGDLPLALRYARQLSGSRPDDKDARLWLTALRWQAGGEQAPALAELKTLAAGTDRVGAAARVLLREITPPTFRPLAGAGCWACGFPARSDAYQCPHCLWVLPRIVRIEASDGRGVDTMRWQGARVMRAESESLVTPRLTAQRGGRSRGAVDPAPVRAVHDFMTEQGLLRRIATPGPGGAGAADEGVVRTNMRGSPWRTIEPVDVLLGRSVKAVRLAQLATLTPYLPWSEMSSFEPVHDERDWLVSLRDVQSGVTYDVAFDSDGRLAGIEARDGSLSRHLKWGEGRLRGETLRIPWDGAVSSRSVSHETDSSGRVRRTSVDLPGGNLVVTYE